MFDPAEIGQRIIADDQSNDHCTAYPIFMVQRKRRTWGIDPAYTENFTWFHGDDSDELYGADLLAAERFYRSHCIAPKYISDGIAYGPGHSSADFGDCDYYSHLRRVGYVDTWENEQPFFTRAGAERYIKENGHNLREPRIYVECAFRNREWQAMREHLQRIAVAAIQRIHDRERDNGSAA